jgi:hypothetical protein
MKIAIGINIFGYYKRQDQCIEVLNNFASKYPEIELYNITHEGETHYTNGFKHLPLLKRKAKDVISGSISEKPIAKDFFDVLSQQDCDYFLFLNSDILISRSLIELLLKAEYETYSFSRADCYPIENIKKIIPYRTEIAGFDAWAVKKSWWIENRQYFDDYVYSEHLWDVAFAVEMYNRSNSIICNKQPIHIYHEKHELKWNESSSEALHNSKLWENTPYHERWHNFIYSYLVRRLPMGQFLYPLSDELQKEKEYLNVLK